MKRREVSAAKPKAARMSAKSSSLDCLSDRAAKRKKPPLGRLLRENTYPQSRGLFRSFPDHVVLDVRSDGSEGCATRMRPCGAALNDARRTIHQVARDGDVYAMKALLDNHQGSGARRKLNELNDDRMTPLHYAARYNNFAMVKLLVEKGADTNVRGEEGLTALHLAARYKKPKTPKLQRQKEEFSIKDYLPSLRRSLERYSSGYSSDGGIPVSGKPCDTVVLLLAASGAEVNCGDDYGLAPLHYAAMRGNAVATRDLLTCQGIDVEARDNDETTPLHLAAVHGNGEIARLLLDAGAHLRCRDENSATPLHRAAREGNFSVVKMLVEEAENRGGQQAVDELISDRDNEQNTALHLAVENSYLEITEYLLSRGAEVNVSRNSFVYPLHLAAVSGDVDILSILLAKAEKIDCLNANHETPLHRAAEFNHTQVIELLVKHDANMESRDKDNCTPLLLAANHGHLEAIECLLGLGADMNAADKDDKTAIYWAAQQNKHEALRALLQDPRSRYLLDRADRYGNSPLHQAAKKGYLPIMQTLIEQGAHVDLKNEEEQMPLHLAAKCGRTTIVRELIKHNKQIVNGEDEEGNTSLHLAALEGHQGVLKVLLDVGANVEARNSRLWTPLDCAAYKGWIRCVQVLLAANCPVDPLDRAKTTPLHLAASAGRVDVCMLLLESGANVSRRDDHGRNCLELAIESSQREVVMAIIQSRHWMDAMRSDCVAEDAVKRTPLRLLIRKMPEAAEEVCNRCTRSNELPSDHPQHAVTFDYELLDDTYTRYGCGADRGSARRRHYSQYGSVSKENHPLMIMVRSRRQKLLAHPLCISLIHIKWLSFGRYVYYSNLFMYLLFVAALTGFLLSCPIPSIECLMDHPRNDSEWRIVSAGPACPEILFNGKPLAPSFFCLVCKYVVIALSTFHLFRELFQMYMLRLNYLDLENLMEWGCYVTALLFVTNFSDCSETTGLRQRWQWEIGALGIFLGWMNLILFIRKLPYLGIYVVMFIDVLTTFCKVCVVFFFFIVAFALAFHTVMHYEDPFSTAGKSIVRSLVMMLGEMEFDDIFRDDNLRYPVATYFFFASFIVLICLITMNLLVGLAVDDIKTVQEQASLKRLAMQVELVLSVESVLPRFLQERFVVDRRSFLPNRARSSPFEDFLSRFNTTQTVREALMAREKTDLERIEEHQEAMMDKMASLAADNQRLQKQTAKLHGLVRALGRHQGLAADEEEEDKYSEGSAT